MNVSTTTTQPHVNPSQVPLEALAGNRNISDSDKVAEVSRQFEAVLVRQIMQDIRKPVLAPEQGDPATSGIYNDMINNQLADNITRSGGLGLAQSLTSELSHQVLAHSALPSSTTAKTATATTAATTAKAAVAQKIRRH